MATTENGALSNPTTSSARLNLFFKFVRSLATNIPLLHQLLSESWSENSLDTLKLIFQTRDCRGGKGERKLFVESVLWLATHHPETLQKNIKHIPYFGTWKDLLLLMPTAFADDALKLFAEQLKSDREKVKQGNNDNNPKSKKEGYGDNNQRTNNEKYYNNISYDIPLPTNESDQPTYTDNSEITNNEHDVTENSDLPNNKDKPKATRPKKERPPLPFISLAAKWAPTENHHDDNKTGSALKLALLLSTGNAKHALRNYRKLYLSPLRAHLQVIETFMCAKKWELIPYSLVPSRCMDRHKGQYAKHDEARFLHYLKEVKEGNTTIKGKQMFPHELVARVKDSKDEVAELQWQVIVDEVRKMGKLDGSLVLSDVSGSMTGTPMLVSIALGLLISEITPPPFTNCVITFHSNPTFHVVSGDTFQARVHHLSKAEWGSNTDFQAVFELILTRALAHHVDPSHMPKRLFVISDMQFDAADGNFYTNHEAIKRKYHAAGYQMPQIVYWNVRTSNSANEFPVQKHEEGVAMVSGFSPSMLKSLLSLGDFVTPDLLLRKILDNPRYSILEL